MNKLETNDDYLEQAMSIQTQQEADTFFNDYINFLLKSNPDIPVDAWKEYARQNIGYYAGYYDRATGHRMEKYFGAIHPILGDMETRSKMTSSQIFELGKAYATKLKET